MPVNLGTGISCSPAQRRYTFPPFVFITIMLRLKNAMIFESRASRGKRGRTIFQKASCVISETALDGSALPFTGLSQKSRSWPMIMQRFSHLSQVCASYSSRTSPNANSFSITSFHMLQSSSRRLCVRQPRKPRNVSNFAVLR